MSSRYYNNNFSPPQYSQPYRPRVTAKQSSYYSKPSAPQYTVKSQKPKSRPSAGGTAIRDSGTGPYTPTLGRKKQIGQWKAKKKQDKSDKKTKIGSFNQEAIEAELNKYKKGVFYHNDAKAEEEEKNKINGHHKPDAKDKHSQFQLTRTQKPPPPIYDELPRAVPPNYDERIKSSDTTDDTMDENTKQSTTKRSSKQRKQVIEDTKQKETSDSHKPSTYNKKSSSSKSKSKKQTAPMVTVSPSRLQPANYGGGYYGPSGPRGPPMDPYYGAPPPGPPRGGGYYGPPGPPPPYARGAGAGAGAGGGGYYDRPPYARDDMYPMQAPPTRPYGALDPYSNTYPQYGHGAYNTYPHGIIQDDGSWYPYPDVLATGAAGAATGADPYATPKMKRDRNKKPANVDLTTPNIDNNNNKKDKRMSPGRRVNKIQKQLEYYFSISNMNSDEFLLESMDSRGWVHIDTLLAFNRMTVLGATKELVVEAAFHSTVIEIDKSQDKIRMSKLWKQYVEKTQQQQKKSSSRRKEKKRRERDRQREKEKEKELDNADVNQQTIESIVAGIEKKHEKRKKRRQQREKEKEKEKKKKNENDDNDNDNEKKEKEEAENKENKSENTNKSSETNNVKESEEDVRELIKKDKEKGTIDAGDPNHTDMVEID